MINLKPILLIILLLIINFVLAFKLLNTANDWFVGGFLIYVGILFFIIKKTIKKL